MLKTLAVLLFTGCVFAQTPDTAVIQGRVLDQGHGAIAGARIAARNLQTGLERSAESDSAGGFSMAGLPVSGAYEITASKSGFADARLRDITLTGGATATVNLEMNVAGAQSTIEVTGVAGEVRTDAPQVNTSLQGEQIRDLPLLSRRITNVPLLNAANRPAISQGDVFINQTLFTTNGAGRRQARFEVDGGTDNDSWGRQTIFSTLPVTAVQEMTVLTNAFSAEYGASTGGVVNIVTRTGGDNFTAMSWSCGARMLRRRRYRIHRSQRHQRQPVTSDTLGQSAASLCGPIGAHTHFFTAGEFSRQDGARRSPRRSRRESSSDTIAAGWHFSAWTIKSTTGTICSSAAMSTASTIPIRTARWAATTCRRWIAFSGDGRTRHNSERRRC